MAFKVVGGKVQKKTRKEPVQPPTPPEFVDFRFELPEGFKPEITDNETRRVLAAVYQSMAQTLWGSEWAATFRAEGLGPQQLCENILSLHEAGLIDLADDGKRVGMQLTDPTLAKRLYNS